MEGTAGEGDAQMPERRITRPPTHRQIALLAVMSAHHSHTGAWPTHRQIASALALATTNLTPALRLLEAKGLIRKDPRASRRNRALTELGQTIATEETRGPHAP